MIDKEIKDYIDERVKEEVTNYFEHKEEARKKILSQSIKYKNDIRALLIANADDVKKAYGEIYKEYSEDTGDNIYASAKEKGLSIIDYVCQFGDVKNLYGIALAKFGKEEKKLPSEEELEKRLDEEDVVF
jgi:hypothetical protein